MDSFEGIQVYEYTSISSRPYLGGNVAIAAYIFRECISACHWPNLAVRIPRNSFPLTATFRVNQHEIKNNIDCAFPSTR